MAIPMMSLASFEAGLEDLRALFGDLSAEEAPEDVSAGKYPSGVCRAEGCGEGILRRKGGVGGGYCPRHSRNFYRYGHPEPRREYLRDRLADAAHGFTDGELEIADLALAGARWAAHLHVTNPLGEVDAILGCLSSPEVSRLARAARRYSECDSEAPLAVFERLSRELEDAAHAAYRAIPRNEGMGMAA